MEIRHRVILNVDIIGTDEKDIADKFIDLDLGNLDEEKNKGNCSEWDYTETEFRNKINDNGTVGEEL